MIVVDIGGMHGTEDMDPLQRLRATAPATCVIIVLTLHGDEDTRARAREAGAQAFLEKERRRDGPARGYPWPRGLPTPG